MSHDSYTALLHEQPVVVKFLAGNHQWVAVQKAWAAARLAPDVLEEGSVRYRGHDTGKYMVRHHRPTAHWLKTCWVVHLQALLLLVQLTGVASPLWSGSGRAVLLLFRIVIIDVAAALISALLDVLQSRGLIRYAGSSLTHRKPCTQPHARLPPCTGGHAGPASDAWVAAIDSGGAQQAQHPRKTTETSAEAWSMPEGTCLWGCFFDIPLFFKPRFAKMQAQQ